MPRQRVGHVELDYDLHGDGPPVVQLHGLTSSRARLAHHGMDLATGPADRQVLRYDARGHGASSGTDDPHSYTWAALAGDLLTLLQAIFGDRPVHGVGESMGVGTLLHAATRRPEAFSGLTLAIPPTAWSTRPAQAQTYLANADLVRRYGVDRFVRVSRPKPTPPAVDTTRGQTPPSVAENLLPTVFTGAAASDLPPVEAVGRLDLPTRILGWDDDPSHPLSTAEKLLDVLPDARLDVARTPADVARWPQVLADQLSRTTASR